MKLKEGHEEKHPLHPGAWGEVETCLSEMPLNPEWVAGPSDLLSLSKHSF